MNHLHVDSVAKSFGLNQVLTDIFISCSKGEIIGLLGRNGAGKSTLLKIIFGSMSADYKFVQIGAKRMLGISDNRKLINFLPQHHFLPSHLKIGQIISIFCSKSNAAVLTGNVHILPYLQKRPDQLSGGERRMVEILLVIHSDASFVLMDEPFNGVEPIHKEELKMLIKEHSGTKGFILTDHDYRNILDISTRTILMRDGGLEEIKNRDELKFWNYIPDDSI